MPSCTSRARREQVLRLRRAGERARQAADDEDEARRVERAAPRRRRAGCRRARRAGRRRPSPGTCRRGSSPRARARAPRTSSAVRSRPIAWTWSRHGEIARMPWPDARLDDRVERSRAAQRRGVDREPAVVAGEVAHGDRRRPDQPSTPCSASRWRMRATASSGCSIRPARVGEAERSRRSGAASARSAGRRPS